MPHRGVISPQMANYPPFLYKVNTAQITGQIDDSPLLGIGSDDCRKDWGDPQSTSEPQGKRPKKRLWSFFHVRSTKMFHVGESPRERNFDAHRNTSCSLKKWRTFLEPFLAPVSGDTKPNGLRNKGGWMREQRRKTTVEQERPPREPMGPGRKTGLTTRKGTIEACKQPPVSK